MTISQGQIIAIGNVASSANTDTLFGLWVTDYASSNLSSNVLNSGTVYGTDSVPGADQTDRDNYAPYMGGPASGPTVSQIINPVGSTNTIAAGDPANARILTNKFLSSVRVWGTIRPTTYTKTITGGGTTQQAIGKSYLLYDLTNPKYAPYYSAVPDPGSPFDPVLGNTITATSGAANIVGYFDALRASYQQNVENTMVTVNYEICHSSCHSSCHGSRGRR
jgi:hypothetical protein